MPALIPGEIRLLLPAFEFDPPGEGKEDEDTVDGGAIDEGEGEEEGDGEGAVIEQSSPSKPSKHEHNPNSQSQEP